jgi:multi antimicrobial extrusion protein matE
MIRLDGAPKLAMMCNIIAAIITVILGWLFIFPLGWGLMGAAFAATIGLFASGATGLIYLWKFAHKLRLYPIKWSIRSFRFSLLNIVCQCRIGSSALLTEATLATFMFVGNHIFMKYLGDNGVGAFGIACYYLPFVFMVGNAIAQSAQPIISYNFGLGEKKRVTDTKRIALFTSVICGIVTTAAFILFPHILVGLFVNPDSTAALIAIEGFPYFSLAFVFFIINLMLIGYYQSVKNVKLANLFALLRGFVFLIPCFILLPEAMGTNGAWLALCLSEMLTTLTVAILFILRKKKNTPASNKVKNAVKRFFSGMPRHAHKIPASEYR